MPLVIQLPFDISVDLSAWIEIFGMSNSAIINAIFAIVGWVAIAGALFYMGSILWADYRNSTKEKPNWKWVLLAVDIPEELVQSPKAVEQIFAHLSGAALDIDVIGKYWHGLSQKWFSFEVISIEGYIQFLIRTEDDFRDLVEASIYAQYPEAEITEVEDYVDKIPDKFPSTDYDVAGLEFGLMQENSYPIRTYEEFEHSLSKDTVFTDPMAAILENFSRASTGENLWMQIIVTPTNNSWKEEGIKLAKELIEQKKPVAKQTIVNKAGDLPMKVAKEALKAWKADFSEEAAAENKPEEKATLTPGMRSTVEAIEEKISKIGFKTKIRILYAANKSVFKPSKCLQGFVGSLNQFFSSTRNGITPKATADSKKGGTNFVEMFKKRKLKMGISPFILNITELATVWHFPLAFVKTPLIQKTASKRAEPPTGLPVDEIAGLAFEGEEVEMSPPKVDNNRVITDADGDILGVAEEKPIIKVSDKEDLQIDETNFTKDMPYG